MKLRLISILILISFSLDCVSTEYADKDIPCSIAEPADLKDLQVEVKEDTFSIRLGGKDDL